jgi:mRNA-degrading endonuclease YafQ of YafQ-DinJ toxin-antitoxin module
MEFRIADTFYKALTKLSNEEMKAAKMTVFDLQADMSGNSLRLHKLDRAKDKRFWSVSVNMDIRIIVHKDGDSLLLCYVDHHDEAYKWAQNRRLEVHPTTGAAQIVEVVETVEEIMVPIYKPETVQKDKPRFKERPLRNHTDEFLMKYGVPEIWLDKLRSADEDELLALAERLPSEAGEAVLDLAVGVVPEVPKPIAKDTNPFEHPDAMRRFRTIDSKEELAAALDFPWDKWTVFLHPSQRAMVGKDFSGPARVSGAAGTGKTVVALHRAVHLAKADEGARILLTTFSDALANALQDKCYRLLRPEPRLAEQIDVYALDAVGERLYEARGGKKRLVDPQTVRSYITGNAKKLEQDFTDHFLFKEWEEVVDPIQLTTLRNLKASNSDLRHAVPREKSSKNGVECPC